MTRRISVLALASAALLGATALGASAASLRYANQGDLKSLDPYTLNETTANAHLGHVYEGLTKRGKDLAIEPGLAESWEILDDGKRWRFELREGVTFHNGNPFTADDVLFSADRVRATGSNFQTRVPATATFVKIDDYTVDVVLETPNPILNAQWDTWYIMDEEWAQEHGAEMPTSASATTPSHAALNANGTGPFTITVHEPGIRTVFTANADWWDEPEHNLDEIVFTPIASDATRVAALLSGEVDVIEPVPVQDIERVRASDRADVLTGPELRTIFLGFDQERDELLYSNVTGENPFKDVRVREAFMRAIDADLIRDRVMRGLSTPSALMIAPELFAYSDQFERTAYDPDRARELLAEAGYPDGFEVGMDCPNDRYVNDEGICQGVVSMLARVGVTVNLNAQPKAQYFAKVLRSGGYDTSFYLLGWTPGTFDSHNVLNDLHGCRAEGSPRGETNLGGYCNEEVDALIERILVESDEDARNDLIKQAYEITTGEFAYIPLHQQALAWGVASGVELVQRADNQVMLYWARKGE